MATSDLEDKARSGLPKATPNNAFHLDSRLDALWEEYLGLLDQYTRAREEISKLMSAGFFSLAQANRSPMHSRRYGQDWYDERMKATRRCQVVEPSEYASDEMPGSRHHHIVLVAWTPTPALEDLHGSGDAESQPARLNESDDEPKQQPSPPGRPTPPSTSPTEAAKDTQNSKPVSPMDPIRWYGILVPPELRKSQASFTSAIHESPSEHGTVEEGDRMLNELQQAPLLRAANAARAMKAIDAEIRRLRKFVKKADRAAVEGKHQEPRG